MAKRRTYEQLRNLAFRENVPVYRIEAALGVPKSNLSRMFQFDPGALASQERTDAIMNAIQTVREK